MNLKPVLERVGVLRNQLLIFVILGVIVLNWFAGDLSKDSERWVKKCGVIMHFLTVPIFVGSLVFYCWLLVRMPGTALEKEFSNDAEAALKKHKQKKERQSDKRRNQ